MSIRYHFFNNMFISNTSSAIWNKPFYLIVTKISLFIIYNKPIMDRTSHSDISIILDISKRGEELVAYAKALVEQHELNILTDYYKKPVSLDVLFNQLADQLEHKYDG